MATDTRIGTAIVIVQLLCIVSAWSYSWQLTWRQPNHQELLWRTTLRWYDAGGIQAMGWIRNCHRNTTLLVIFLIVLLCIVMLCTCAYQGCTVCCIRVLHYFVIHVHPCEDCIDIRWNWYLVLEVLVCESFNQWLWHSLHKSIRIKIGTYLHACIHAHTGMHTYMQACIRRCIQICIKVDINACMHAYKSLQ